MTERIEMTATDRPERGNAQRMKHKKTNCLLTYKLAGLRYVNYRLRVFDSSLLTIDTADRGAVMQLD